MSKMKAILIALCLAVFLGFASPVNAATLWLSPASGTYGKGSTVKVNIGVNTNGEYVNAVQANVAYPTDKLQFSSLSTAGSAMAIIAEKTVSGGIVRLGGGTMTPGFSGSKFLGAIYFKALSDSGTAALSFAGDSVVLRDSDNQNILSGGSTVTYKLSEVSAVAPTPQGTGEDLVISDISVSDLTVSSATITWKTNKEATSAVEYGTSEDYGFTDSSDELTKDHKIILSELLTAGTSYHFRVVSKDAQDNEILSEDQTFELKGYEVIIKVIDSKGRALQNAEVILYPSPIELVTKGDGTVLFSGIAPGEHGLTVKHSGRTQVKAVEVEELDAPQTFTIAFAELGFFSKIKAGDKRSLLILVTASLLVVVLIGTGIYFIIKGSKKTKPEASVFSNLGSGKPEDKDNTPGV